MSNQQLTQKPTIQKYLEAYKGQIAAALPEHLTPERMSRLALTEIRKNQLLLKADPVSLFGAIIQASQLGLEPGIYSWLVPFWSSKRKCYEVQMIPDYRGLMRLAFNSEKVTNIEATAVYRGDKFSYQYGTEKYLTHVPREDGDDEELTHVYAIAWIKDVTKPQFIVLTRGKVEKVKERTKSRDRSGKIVGPWITDFESMGIKSAVRRLCKFLPTDIEKLHRAISLDEKAEAGFSQNNAAIITGEFEAVDESEPTPTQETTPKEKIKEPESKSSKTNKQPPRQTRKQVQVISENDADVLRHKLESVGMAEGDLCEAFSIDVLEALPKDQFQEANKWINEGD